MYYCRKCGLSLPDDAVTCPRCEEPSPTAVAAAALPRNRGLITAASVLSFVAYVIIGISVAAFFVFYFSAYLKNRTLSGYVVDFEDSLIWTMVSMFILVFQVAFAVGAAAVAGVCRRRRLVTGEYLLTRGVLPLALGFVLFVLIMLINFAI